jgi:ADP-ribose pyrophosphatase YjhB (NUDIX family)
MIKKARWPYTGMYDLPGGWIEFLEYIEQALGREIMEETWVSLVSKIFIWNNEYFCEYTSRKGIQKEFHHIGFYYAVDLEDKEVKTSPD